MKPLLSLITCIVALFALTFNAYAQTHHHTQPQIIDGSKTPEQIPDAVARRLFFYNITTPEHPIGAELAEQTGKLKTIGLTLQEAEKLRQELARFRKEFDAEVARYNESEMVKRGLAPYDITERLDRVVSAFRARLPGSLLDAVEQRMRSEKSGMKMTSPTPDTATSMVPNYSSYSGVVSPLSAFGTLGGGLSETLLGSTTCYGGACPACTHQALDANTFNGGNTWSPNYPGLSDGTSISSVSTGADGTLIALNNLGNPYVFGSTVSSGGSQEYASEVPCLNCWTPISGVPGKIGHINIESATQAFATVYSGSTYKAYLWNPTTNVWTLQSPPVASSVNIVKVENIGPGTVPVFAALDSTNTAWIYSSNGTSLVWARVQGSVYDIGGIRLAIGPPNSSGGNVWFIMAGGIVNGVPTFYLSSNSPTAGLTLASFGDGAAYGIDPTGAIWQAPTNSSNNTVWTKFLPTPPIAVKQISGSGVNSWFTDGNGHLVRYLANVTTNTASRKVNPTSYIGQNNSNVAYNVLGGNVFTALGTVRLNCSCVGTLYSAAFSFDWEIAYTRADWIGTPPPTCWQLLASQIWQCDYQVVNNCTAATTPPDNDFNGKLIGPQDYRGIATYLSWKTAAACYRWTGTGPWTCLRAAAWLEGLNSRMPPFDCTVHP